MAQKPSLALTQSETTQFRWRFTARIPVRRDFEGLTKTKLELCDKADAIVTRLETRADAAEKFINSPVTSLLFFWARGGEERDQSQIASRKARAAEIVAIRALPNPSAAQARQRLLWWVS